MRKRLEEAVSGGWECGTRFPARGPYPPPIFGHFFVGKICVGRWGQHGQRRAACHAPPPPPASQVSDSNPPMPTLVGDAKVFTCKRVAQGLPLSPLAICVLFLYTCESELCYGTNRALRSGDPRRVDPWRPFVYHLSQALHASAVTAPKRVYRGVQLPLTQGLFDQYAAGQEVPFHAFTSTSTNYKVSTAAAAPVLRAAGRGTGCADRFPVISNCRGAAPVLRAAGRGGAGQGVCGLIPGNESLQLVE